MIHCRRRANVQTEAHAILPARSRRWVLWAVLAMTLAAVPAHAQPYVYALGYEPTPSSAYTRLVAIDASTNGIVGSVVLGENPAPRNEHLAISPDGSRIVVVNNSERTVSVISAQTLALLDTYSQALLGIRPAAVTVSSDSRRVYVSGTTPVNGQDQAFVSVIDIASRSRVGTVPLGTPEASGLAASPDGSRLYVLTINPQTVKIVDTVTNSVINTVPLRLTNFGTTVKLSPDGRYAYFPRSSTTFATPGVMEVLDTTIETIVASPTIGVEPLHVGVSPNGAVVYAPGSRSRRIDRLNPLTHAAEGATPLTKAASSVAFLPDSLRAYVAAGVDIFVIDATTHAVVRTISMWPVGLNFGVSAVVATPPPFVPPGSTPTGLHAPSIVGNRVTLAWTAPTSVSPTSYVVEGGVSRGQVLASLPTGSPATTFTFDAPTGVYYVRVHALSASGRSFASNEILIAVNMPPVPSPPADLLGLANGPNLLLSWRTTYAGGPPASHVLDVSGAATLSVPVPAGETFSYAGVPGGTYTFTVRAVNITGVSAPSAPLTLTFPSVCSGPPQEPVNFTVSRGGSQLTVSWDPPGTGSAVSSYVLRVTGALNLELPVAGRSISGSVAPGTYNLSVRAVNPCGFGVQTVPQSVTVP